MHVVVMAPHFPAYQRHFARALHGIGATVTGIGDWPWENLDRELQSWLTGGYVRVPKMDDDEAIMNAVGRINRQLKIDRLEVTIELQMLTAARARAAYGIEGPSEEEVLLCRDKYAMKKFLKKHGIPCADVAEVKSKDDARQFTEKNGFPVILKPADMAGAYDTHVVRDAAELEKILTQMRIGVEERFIVIEEFVSGEEGFYDTLVCEGEVKFEAIALYYPNVLEAMRTRWISPQIIHTNRFDDPEYKPVIELGRKVIKALNLKTCGTHMEWFKTKKGYYFSEIGARPAGVRFWDIYCHANQFDLYTDWAKAVVHGKCEPKINRKYSMGLISFRPSQEGRITGFAGVEDCKHRFGQYIRELSLPGMGSPAQPVGNGYMAHAWAHVFHEDFDECRRMMSYMGENLKVWAQ